MSYNSKINAALQIGSVFEYVNDKPVFGVLNSDSIFYAPVLGFFAFTGIPTSVSHSISLDHFFWFQGFFLHFYTKFLYIESIDLNIIFNSYYVCSHRRS